ERALAPLGITPRDQNATVDAPAYLRHIERTVSVPLMRVNLDPPSLDLALDGQVHSRTAPLPSSEVLDTTLSHIERYMATVDWGPSADPEFAKASLFEALLFVLGAPFTHEHMRLRREAYALVDRRGPRALYIVGPSQNGKSTFMRFALQVLSGQHTAP